MVHEVSKELDTTERLSVLRTHRTKKTDEESDEQAERRR